MRSKFSSQVLEKKACKDNLITSASHLCSNDTVLDKKCAHNRVVDDERIAVKLFKTDFANFCRNVGLWLPPFPSPASFHTQGIKSHHLLPLPAPA